MARFQALSGLCWVRTRGSWARTGRLRDAMAILRRRRSHRSQFCWSISLYQSSFDSKTVKEPDSSSYAQTALQMVGIWAFAASVSILVHLAAGNSSQGWPTLGNSPRADDRRVRFGAWWPLTLELPDELA